mgnify:CR=1 FL=1
MNLEEALIHFELEKGATFFQLEEKYSGLKQQYDMLMENAPNPTVLRVYKKNLDDLDAAFNFAASALKEPMTEELAFSIISLPTAASPVEIEAQYKRVKFELEAGMKIPDKAVQAECRYELQRLEESISLINKLLDERKKKQQFAQLIRQGDQQLSELKFDQASTSYKQAGMLLNNPLVQQKSDALALIKAKIEKEEQERKEREEQERKQREEAERQRKEKEEQDRKDREEKERKQREEAERQRKEKEEQDRKDREEKERKQREEDARKEKEEQQRIEKIKREQEEKKKNEPAAIAEPENVTARETIKSKSTEKNKEEKYFAAKADNKPVEKTNLKTIITTLVVLIVAVASGYIFYSTHLATVIFIADSNAELTLGGGTVLELTANEKSIANIAPGKYEYSAQSKETGATANGTFIVDGRFGEVVVKIALAAVMQTSTAAIDTTAAVATETDTSFPENTTTKDGNNETVQNNNVKTETAINTVVAVNPTTTVTQTELKSPAGDSKIENEQDAAEFNLWWLGLDATWKLSLIHI